MKLKSKKSFFFFSVEAFPDAALFSLDNPIGS